jgi:hypothetical protein
LTASASVGCAAIESATVSMVASASMPMHARVHELGRLRPTMTEAQQLAVAGLVDRLHPARLLAVHLRRAGRENGNRLTATSSPCASRRLRLGQADGRHLGIGVDCTGGTAV